MGHSDNAEGDSKGYTGNNRSHKGETEVMGWDALAAARLLVSLVQLRTIAIWDERVAQEREGKAIL